MLQNNYTVIPHSLVLAFPSVGQKSGILNCVKCTDLFSFKITSALALKILYQRGSTLCSHQPRFQQQQLFRGTYTVNKQILYSQELMETKSELERE